MKHYEAVMSNGVSRKRLRLVFLASGGVLVLSMLALGAFVHKRLQEAARSREEMVVSRVFDEFEREVSVFLEAENSRTHYSSLEQTDSRLWAPFVVGYFRIDAQGPFTVAAEGDKENERRVAWAVERLRDRRGKTESTGKPSMGAQSEERKAGSKAPAASGALPVSAQPQTSMEVQPEKTEMKGVDEGSASGSKIIESLNRAPERRKQKVSPSGQAPSRASQDPFSDYVEAF